MYAKNKSIDSIIGKKDFFIVELGPLARLIALFINVIIATVYKMKYNKSLERYQTKSVPKSSEKMILSNWFFPLHHRLKIMPRGAAE